MFKDDVAAGSWDELAERVDHGGAIGRWARAEPALRGVATVAELAELTGPDGDRARADAVLGALIRTGSSRGGDDADALLLVLHLLSAGVAVIAAELADLHPTVLQLVVGELTVAVRSFGALGPRGGGRRNRAFAANLLRDARRAVLRELRPHCTPKRPHDSDILIDPLNALRVNALFDLTIPGPGENGDLELVDVLQWAQHCGVAAEQDLRVLLAAEHARDRSTTAESQSHIAAALGIHASTLRRRRERALRALRSAHRDYLDQWLAS
jgi:hypothetical protein